MTIGRFALLSAGALGFVGVALGAFGAHALKGWLASQPDGELRLGWWQTGVQYQMWHALLLFGVGLWLTNGTAAAFGPLRTAVVAVIAGTALFSGSLYVMTLSGIRALGAVTPLGGVAFLVSWGALALAAWQQGR